MKSKSNAQTATHRLAYDRYIRYLFLASAILMSVIVLSILFFMGQQGLQTFREVSPFEFFFSTKWDPSADQYGALSFIAGSIYVAVLAVLFGAPLGLAGAIFMAKVAPKRMREIMRPANDLYVAIPSVVYGYLGLTVLAPFLRDQLHLGIGFGMFAAGLILGIMILPTVISISEDALRSVPAAMEEASIALGATRWQTIWRVLAPTAMPGIITGITLTAGRAVGETAILIFTAGTSVSRSIPDFSLSAGGETLAVHMWYVMAIGLVPDRLDIANGVGALLILMILAFNLLLASSSKYVRKWLTGVE